MGNPLNENNRLLLVVDDEPEIREILVLVAQQANLNVIAASSGNEAFSIIQKNPVTAIITDMNMPNGDGKSLLFNVRASGLATPCAFVTAYETKDFMQDALRLGAYEFIPKPFDITLLESLMCRIMALGSSIQHNAQGTNILKENAFHQAMAYKKLSKALA